MDTKLWLQFAHEPDIKVDCEYCGEEYEWNHGYGTCPNNCEEDMKKEELEILNGIYDSLAPCPQPCRPIGNLLDTLYFMQENIDINTFKHLFPDTYITLWERYNSREKNILSFSMSLPIKAFVKFAQYIENSTIAYDVTKYVAQEDISTFLKCNANMIPVIVKDVNHSKYGGTFDENEVIRWVVMQRKK